MKGNSFSNKSVSSRMRSLAWVTLLVAVAAWGAVFVWHGAKKAIKMQAPAATGSQLAQAKAQESVQLVIEVLETTENEIRGRLLEKQDEDRYTRTRDEARIQWNSATPVVMGKTTDVHSSAIIHVTGTVSADHSLQARQIVILTGYVKVK